MVIHTCQEHDFGPVKHFSRNLGLPGLFKHVDSDGDIDGVSAIRHSIGYHLRI